MKKTLLIAAAATLSLFLSSVVFAGNIEKAERYSAPLEQNVVEMDVSTVEMGQEIAPSELSFGLSSNAEIQYLGRFVVYHKEVWWDEDGNKHKKVTWFGDCEC